MVKIIATSDFHSTLPTISECDLLLICGDICPDGSPTFQAYWLDGVFRKWLEKVPAKEIIGIAGNHDLIFERAPSLVPSGLRWHYLKDQMIEQFGLKIYGTPWQLPFWGAFNCPEATLREHYAQIPKGIDILISHSPPYGILDEVPHDNEEIGYVRHTGSLALRNKIFEIKPQLFVCGHIHCAFGTRQSDGITFANVCLLNDQMEAAHKPVVFDISPGSFQATTRGDVKDVD